MERAARGGDAKAFDLPRPMLGKPGCDFSFSGLKTAVRRTAIAAAPMTERQIADLCAAFQHAVADVLDDRLRRAIDRFAGQYPRQRAPNLVVAGGVAANAFLRGRLGALAEDRGFGFVAPPLQLCTDNAAMIAHAGALRLRAGLEPHEATPRPRWPLDEASAPRLGHGKRGAKV